MLTGKIGGPKAAGSLFSYLGSNIDEVIINIITKPYLIFQNIDWTGAIVYLVLISIALVTFWSKSSIFVLSGAIPLVIVNIISEDSPQRTLIHHYSLPIAVIAVTAAIDGLANYPQQKFPWKKLLWASVCWAALAKPWFFTGPYLSRLYMLPDVYSAIESVDKGKSILTSSYLAPQLTHRENIQVLRTRQQLDDNLFDIDILLLNPDEPGWSSNRVLQHEALAMAEEMSWECNVFESSLQLCLKNN